MEIERSFDDESFNRSEFNNTHALRNTNVELVLSKLPHPELCIIRKGYYPDTAQGLEDAFCFVMLDMDLYLPTLEGLRFFYEKMTPGGVILIHDYFTKQLPNVKRAVQDYEEETRRILAKTPIGDALSLAIIKV